MFAAARALAALTLVAGVLFAPCVAGAQTTATAPSGRKFVVQRLAEGIHAVIRTDPPGLMFEANSAFIIGDHDVIVVDGGSNPASALEVLAALRRLTTKPVRYVINTHWHGDHVTGNRVYADSFPGVDFIAHATSLADLNTEGLVAQKGFVDNAAGYANQLRGLLGKSAGLDGHPLSAEERESHLTSIALVDYALAAVPMARHTPPTMTLDDRMTLHRGERTIDVRWFGKAHTRGDIVIHLPKEGILFTGDLVAAPVPLVGSTSFPLEYGATLEKMLELRPSTIVPGHGPVQRDDSYARLMARMLDSIKSQTEAAVARGETLQQTRRSVDLAEFRRLIAGDSKVRAMLFSQYVQGPAVARAFEAASAAKAK